MSGEMRWWRVERERKDDLHVCCAEDLCAAFADARERGGLVYSGEGYLSVDGDPAPHPICIDWETVTGVYGEAAPPRPRGPLRE